jgi:hypothetical protein
MSARFFLDWVSGSSAVVDVQAQVRDQETRFMLRYTSPFRPTMRSPQRELGAGRAEFDQVDTGLDGFARRSMVGARRGPAAAGGAQAADAGELAELGIGLFELLLPPLVRTDLRREGLFVELGTDEDLLHLPWEVMHDGDDFICMKHFVGRYVNLRRTPELQARAMPEPGADVGELRVLVVAVPQPLPQGDLRFEALPSVEAERDAIVATLGEIGVEPAVLSGDEATTMRVLSAMRGGYQVVHFSGHAAFDPADPSRSSIVCHDGKLSVARLTAALSEQQTVLYVVNGCETARAGAAGPAVAGGGAAAPPPDDGEQLSWRDQYNMYGLARAFLENGAYVLGSRWKIPDQSARVFAETFYRSFLGQGRPIGRAICEARVAIRDDAQQAGRPWDFSWASYVFYGDPRLCLRPLAPAVAEAGAEQPAADAGADRGVVVAAPADFAGPDQPAAAAGEGAAAGAEPGADQPAVDEGAEDFARLAGVIENPPSDADETAALRALGELLPSLSAAQKRSLGGLLEERASSPDLLGTDRLLLISQLRARLGDTGPGNPDFD